MTILASEVVCWYDHTDGSGSTLTDASDNGYDATINNGSWNTDSPSSLSDSIVYNGSTTTVSLPSGVVTDMNALNKGTIGMWVKKSILATQYGLFTLHVDNTNRSIYFTQTSDDVRGFQAATGGGFDLESTSGDFASNTTWYFITFESDGTDIKIFFNNSQIATSTDSNWWNDLSSPTTALIGALYGGGVTGYLNGRTAQFFVINRELSTAERNAIYNSGNGDIYSNIVSTPGYSNTVNGVTPSKINGIEVANIGKFNGE